MKKTIEKYLQARDEVSFKYNKAGAKIWYRAHAIIETGVIDTGKAYAWSCDHDIKINRFQAALILEKYGLTIEQFIDAEKEFYATRYPETNNITEPNPDDYAINPDALEVAVNAELQNANNEPDTTEPDEPKFQVGKSYYIKDGDNYYILKVESRTDKMLTGTTPHGTCKFHIHDTFKGEYIRTHLYDDCGNREMIWAANEYKPQVDPIIQERETARNEYDQLNQARKAIEKDCERFERLRNRCKANSPKFKEYNQLLESFDPIIRAFGDKFIAAQDRYNQSLTLRTDEERAATQKAIDTHNADLDARGIKYFATVYYYPNGVEGEDMENFFKDCQTLKEATDFVSQEDIDGVYVGGIYDAGWEITDRNGNIVADHITGISSTTEDDDFQSKLAELQDEYDVAIIENKKAIDATKAAEKALQATRELEQIAAGKRIATGNAIYNFGSAKAAELRNKLLPVENFNRLQMFITNQFDCKRAVYLETMYIEFYNYKFSIIADNDYGTFTLGEYNTPAQVEKVIGMFKAAITSGDKDFTFPTVDELTALSVSRNNIKIEKEVRRKTG